MSTPGQQLFQMVTSTLWDLLDRCRSQAASVLSGLATEPGFSGTVLDGRLLAALRPDAITGSDPGVSALLGALQALLPDPSTAGVPVSLHGFDPGSGQPRGLALVASTPSPAITAVAALTGAGPTGLAFEIAAVGSGTFGPVQLTLLGDWSLQIAGDVGGGARLQFPRGGTPQVLDAGAAISVTWTFGRSGAAQPLVLGPDSGPKLALPSVALSAATAKGSGGTPTVTYAVSLPGGQLSLSPDVLAALIGNALSLAVDLDLDADPDNGLKFRSGGVRATIPANVSLPGIDVRAVEIALETAGSGIDFSFGVSFTGGLPGLPLTFTVDGLGAKFPVAVGAGGLGVDPGGVQPALPTGIGVDLSLPVLSGGGFLASTGPGGYGGVLDLDLIEITVQAFGLLQLPVGGQPLSFVAIISIQFPFPGIQLGFGFSLSAVGGVVAVNRRLDTPSLQSAVIDGSANELLFPVDPASHGPAIIATLGQVFPVAEGHVVVGPMLQIAWGGRILTLAIAVVIDLPNPVQFVIIGRLTLALPDPLLPLVFIQATVVGSFQFSPSPSTSVLASLDGSYIAGIALDGDLLFLLRGGDDAAFVLSMGGFHPRYSPPAGVPHLKRLTLAITPPGLPGLRAEAYVAVTSNSVQFGAHLELCAEIAGCGVEGWFDFDALFEWDPVFLFSVSCSAGVAVQVLGETLMGISFSLVLEGPAPWHVHGTGSVDLFLFSASLDFDASWGSAPAALPPPLDLGPVLSAAFAEPAAWIGTPPSDDHAMVTLSDAANALIGGGQSVHPLGGITVRQRAVPFAIQISRYQNQPIPAQTWTIASASLTTTPVALGDPTQDEFPPGEFLNLTEDEKLSRPAFERFTSGAALTAGAVISSDLRQVDTDFEVVLIPDISLGVRIDQTSALLNAEAFLTVNDVHSVPNLWNPQNVQTVVVLPEQPVALASTATMQVQALSGAPGGFTATLQAAQAQFGAVGAGATVQIVEQWEVAA